MIHEKQFDPFPKHAGRRTAPRRPVSKVLETPWFMIPLEETLSSGFLH
ncbi:hypothetical protein PAMC26510_14565 [Caballeronia sordidicola]|uniref:Uncharacterized protein n=1 Tax=Caballeronia sordidicola TaxID=196367 RepID=A0A242MUP8_CABSO|nr:hypothetical protein PAMC26510_14565 [Caballeronia sordidicola]OTP78763.1 hypothetical protein PAMC26577_03990 [Caballeronia sordidicola]